MLSSSPDTLVAILAVAVICCTVVVIGCYYHLTKRRRCCCRDDAVQTKNNATVWVRLNGFEGRLLTSGGRMVSTVTWFRGDHTVAAEHIKQRFDAIVAANRWLTGQIKWRYGINYLVYSRTSGSNNSNRSFDTSETKSTIAKSSDELFLHLSPSESPLSRDTPMEDVSDIVRQHGSISCQPNWNHNIYRICIVPCRTSPQTNFALIVSMSHIAGDAHTFYALYNSLLNCNGPAVELRNTMTNQPDLEESLADAADRHAKQTVYDPIDNVDSDHQGNHIPELTVTRIRRYHDDLKTFMKSRRDPMLSVSLSFIVPSALAMIYGKIRSICNRQYRIEKRYILIDRDKINLMKQEAIVSHSNNMEGSNTNNSTEQLQPPSAATNYCSLNDVVTSWLMMNSNCRHGFMAMNMRNRRLGQNPNRIDTEPNKKEKESIVSKKRITPTTNAINKEEEDEIEIYNDTLAGNYLNLLHYTISSNHHCPTPMSIRQSITNLQQQQERQRVIPTTTTTPPHPVPSTPFLLWGGSIIVTNWCSFRSNTTATNNNHHHSITSKNDSIVIQPLSHVPLSQASEVESSLSEESYQRMLFTEEVHYPLYTYQVDTHPYNTVIAILYTTTTTPNQQQIGLLLCGSPKKLDALVQNCPFVGMTSMA